MEEKLKEIYEKATDIFFSITQKLDDLSERIYEQTGKKIDIKMIILGIILFIFVIFVAKSIIGWAWGFLIGE